MSRRTQVWFGFIGGTVSCGVTAFALPPSYTGLDLGSLGSGFGSALCISNNGDVVGYSNRADAVAAPCSWLGTEAQELPMYPDAENGVANGVNSFGDIVGTSGGRPIRWVNGTLTLLSENLGAAQAVNSFGTVVGKGTVDFQETHPVMFKNGIVIDLGVLPRGRQGEAFDINDFEEVVGAAGGPFLWRNGHLIGLPPMTGTTYVGEALGINNLGQIVGYTKKGTNNFCACIWFNDGDSVRPLSALVNPDEIATGYDINDDQVAVGNCVQGGSFGAIWENGVRTIADDLLHGTETLRTLRLTSINAQGEIVGEGRTGISSGNYRYPAVLLRPDPEDFHLASPSPGIAGIDNTLTATGLLPGDVVNFYGSRKVGLTEMSGCAGRFTSLVQSQLLGTAIADDTGTASVTVFVSPRANKVPVYIQAHSTDLCKVSTLVPYAFR